MMNPNFRIPTLRTLLVVLGLAAGLGGYDRTVAQSPPASALAAYEPLGEVWSRTELYFGTEKPDGSEVSAGAFRRFVDRYVTPRFPDGLTLLRGSGQWREADGDIIKERAFVLVLLYPRGTGDEKIEAVRALYKRAFSQESVLRVDSLERVSF